MLPGMDPKKLEQTLKQLGMKMEDISAVEVVIKTDSGDIVIKDPQVVKTTMKGQVVFQVSGKTDEKQFSDEDVDLVMKQTGVKNKKKAEEALKETDGDVVEAIMKLKGS